MNASTAELIDLFRGSFSPITTLSAGRMAQQQMAIQRAQAEQQRRQALQDHIMGLMIQDRAARARDEINNRRAVELEGLRDKNSIARAASAQEQNRKAAEDARLAAEIRELKGSLTGLGVDSTDLGDDPIKLRSTLSSAVAKNRKSATEIAKQIEGLNTQLETMAGGIEVGAADQLRMAKPYALAAAAGDAEKAKRIKAAASVDDLREIVADDPVALGKIDSAITSAQLARSQAFEKRARPIQTRMTQLQRTLGALEQKGITPDYDELRQTMSGMGAGDAPADAGLDDLSGTFPVLRDDAPASPAAAPSAAGGRSNALTIGAGAAGTAAMIPAARRAVAQGAAAAARGALPVAGRVALGAARAVPYIGPAMLGYGIGSEIDQATGASDAIAGLHGTFGDELGRQRGALARIDQLIRQTQDPVVAGRLRALKYAPVLDEDAIRRAIGQPTSDAAGWLQGY